MSHARKINVPDIIKDDFFSDKFFSIPKETTSDKPKQAEDSSNNKDLMTSIKEFLGIKPTEAEEKENKSPASNLLDIGFPLPESAELLESFLDKNKKEGKNSYLLGVKGQVEKLKNWVKEQKIDMETLDEFYNRHFTVYEKGTSNVTFKLYSEGVYYLHKINILLVSGNIPIDVCCNAIKNLLPGLIVCAPGTHTNILNAYFALSDDLATELMFFRRQIAEQVLLTEISRNTVINNNGQVYYVIDDRFYLYNGSVIHCVNAVLDTVHIQLGIRPSRDEFTKSIDQNLVQYLVNYAQFIFDTLNKNTLISWIINNKLTQLTEIEKRIKSSGFTNEIIESFDSELNHFGVDERFNLNQLITIEDDGNIKISSHADYFLKITLLERLRNSGYLKFKLNKHPVVDNDIGYFFMNKGKKDLEFSLVEVTKKYNEIETKEFVPAIPYLGEDLSRYQKFLKENMGQLIGKDKRLILNEIINLLPDTIFRLFQKSDSNKLDSKNNEVKGDKDKIEFVDKISYVLANTYIAKSSRIIRLNQKVIDLVFSIPNPYRIDIIINSERFRKEDLGERIKEIITNLDDLKYSLQISHWNEFILQSEYKNHISKLISKPNDLLCLLHSLKPENFIKITQYLGASHLQKLVPSNTYLVKIISKLFGVHDLDFMRSIGEDYLRSICLDFYDFIEVINACPTLNKAYMDSLGEEHIERMLEYGVLWFETLKLLSPHLKKDFIFEFKPEFIKAYIENTRDLIEIFSELKTNAWDIDNINKIINFFDKKFIKHLIISIEDLRQFIKCFPEEFQNTLLKELFEFEFMKNLLPNVKFDNSNLLDTILKHDISLVHELKNRSKSDSHSSFEQLINNNLFNHISSYLANKDISRFNRTSKFFQIPNQSELDKKLVTKLLQHVVFGEFEQARIIIAGKPSLLLIKGLAKDHSGRKIEGTALQMALGAEDFNIHESKINEQKPEELEGMSEMILFYFKQLTNSEEEIAKQIQEQFPHGWEDKENKEYQSGIAILNKVIATIIESKATDDQQLLADCNNVINEFRAHFIPKGVIKFGRHFDPRIIDKAFQLYSGIFDLDRCAEEHKLRFYCVRVIGYLQRFFPACYAQAMSQDLYNVVNKPVAEKYQEKLRGYIYDHFTEERLQRHFRLRYNRYTTFFPLDAQRPHKGYIIEIVSSYMNEYNEYARDNSNKLPRLGYDFDISGGGFDKSNGTDGGAFMEREILFESFYQDKSLKLQHYIQSLGKHNRNSCSTESKNDINLQLREAIYSYHDSSKEIDKALAAGADLEFPESGTSLPPLGIAIITKNNIDLIKLLLEKGANPSTKTTKDFKIDDTKIYADSDMLVVARHAPVPATEQSKRTEIVQLLAKAQLFREERMAQLRPR